MLINLKPLLEKDLWQLVVLLIDLGPTCSFVVAFSVMMNAELWRFHYDLELT